MRLFVISILVLVFIGFNIPKFVLLYGSNLDSVEECKCFGIGGEDYKCSGLRINCEEKDFKDYFYENIHRDGFCKVDSCDKLKTNLGIKNLDKKASVDTGGINLLLVIDISLSMQGEYLKETKDAAIKLIQQLGDGDVAGVIVFNNNARVINEFTGNKDVLINSINNITVAEDTRYLPALNEAGELFKGLRNRNRDIMIFLSDGDPLDNKNVILNKVEELSKSIDIYSIWVGKNANTGNFLQIMSDSISDGSIQRYYVSSDPKSLYDSFREIYYTIKKSDYIFNVKRKLPFNQYYSNERIPFDFEVFSINEELVIPGYVKDQDEFFCVNSVDIKIYLDKIGDDKIIEVPIDYYSHSYSGSVDELGSGNYSIYANISLKYGEENSCDFSDYQLLGRLNVVSPEEPIACEPLRCDLFDSVIKNIDLNYFNQSYNEEGNRKIIFAIDLSESMQYRKIEEAKKAFHYFIELFTRNYDLSLIRFNSEAIILNTFSRDTKLLKSKIDDLSVSGTTNYIPVFEKSKLMLDEENKNVIVFFSDGMPWDDASYEDVLNEAETLIDSGTCIYAIGFGSLNNNQKILKEIGILSKRKLNCGGFSRSFNGNLIETFRDIYKELTGSLSDLYLDVEINSQELINDEPFILSTNVISDYNGINFPSIINYGALNYEKELCIPFVDFTMNVKGDNFDESYNLAYNDKGYRNVVSDLKNGIYHVFLDASLKGENDACELKGIKNFTIISKNIEDVKYSYHVGLYISINFFLLCIISLLIVPYYPRISRFVKNCSKCKVIMKYVGKIRKKKVEEKN